MILPGHIFVPNPVPVVDHSIRAQVDHFSRAPKRSRTAIAIVAFENQSGSEQSSWLSVALPEALTSNLTSSEQLRTCSRDEVARARLDLGIRNGVTGDANAKRIAQRLEAQYVITGSYRLSEDGRIHVNARLLPVTRSGTERTIQQSGTEQEIVSIVRALTTQIKAAVGITDPGSGTFEEAHGPLPSSIEATKMYTRGLHLLRNYQYSAAIDCLSRAARADPRFPLIRSNLANALLSAGYTTRAREEAKQALALSGGLPREERLRVEGYYFETLGDWEHASKRFEVLWHFAPDNLEYGLHYAGVLRAGGDFPEALRVLRELRRFQPRWDEDPRLDLSEARVYFLMKDYRRAREVARRAAEKAVAKGLTLCVAEARLIEGRSHLRANRVDEALACLQESERIYDSAGFRAGLAHAVQELSLALAQRDDATTAVQKAEVACTIFREIGDMTALEASLRQIAETKREHGDIAGALAAGAEADAIGQDLERL